MQLTDLFEALKRLPDGELEALAAASWGESTRRLKDKVKAGNYPPLLLNEKSFVSMGQKFQAIKLYHDRTGLSIRECKTVVEVDFEETHGHG